VAERESGFDFRQWARSDGESRKGRADAMGTREGRMDKTEIGTSFLLHSCNR